MLLSPATEDDGDEAISVGVTGTCCNYRRLHDCVHC